MRAAQPWVVEGYQRHRDQVLHRRIRIAVAAVVVSFIVSGCYRQSQHYVIATPLSDAPLSFQLLDQRPASDKDASVEIYPAKHHLGDDQTSPDRMSLLRGKIQERLGSRLAAKTVVIDRFAITNKYKGDTDQGTADIHQALLSPLVTYFLKDEIASDEIICEIHGSVGGQAFGVVLQQPYPIRASPETVETTIGQTTLRAIDTAISDLEKHCGC